MSLLKKNKNNYTVAGYTVHTSNSVKGLKVEAYNNGENLEITLGGVELRVTKQQAREMDRLLSRSLGVFETTSYFD